MMGEKYRTVIQPSYFQLRSVNLGAEPMKNEHLHPGKVTILLDDDDEFSVEGTLSPQGFLTGMAKVYRRLKLQEGGELEFSITNDGSLIVHSPKTPIADTAQLIPSEFSPEAQTVFERMNLKHIHIEAFRPENLNNWEPETEADVYLAFGHLQKYTEFEYCCGASKALIKKFGANYAESAKPDAILIDRATDQYLMAEWKMRSSDFKINHGPEDIDVLVCWDHNETDEAKIPSKVVALRSVAKTAAAIEIASA